MFWEATGVQIELVCAGLGGKWIPIVYFRSWGKGVLSSEGKFLFFLYFYSVYRGCFHFFAQLIGL